MKKINVLHIINDYWSKNLYKFLVAELSKNNIFQTVFVPVRKKKDIGKNKIEKKNIRYLYSYIIKSVIYRVFFWLKIKKSTNFIENNLDINTLSISHAHTLFSDGAISYHFYKKYKIPYVVTVRNTDLNIFYKYLFYLRPLGKQILLNSEKIFFLSEAYRDRLLSSYFSGEIRKNILNKSMVIPNGINVFWHLNSNNEIRIKTKDDFFTFVFVGEFKRNKNIHSVIESIEKLRSKGYNCKFKAIGLGLNDEKDYVKKLFQLKSGKNYIEFINAVKKEELIKLYRKADIFIMPSFKETFGLVYAEALSQGLPVIYTENEGFDKNFDDGFIGYAVNPSSIDDITQKAELIVNNYNSIQKNCKNAFEKYKWDVISDKILFQYRQFLRQE